MTEVDSTIRVIIFIGAIILTTGIGMVLAFLFKGLPARVSRLEREHGELRAELGVIDAHMTDNNRRMESLEVGQTKILDVLLAMPKRKSDR